MGQSVFPPAGGGGIKSVQRGSAASAGDVTITSVDIAKSFVTVFGTASSGTIAATGTLASHAFNTNSKAGGNPNTPALTNSNMTGTIDAAALSGGTNNLVAAVVQGFLANSTTLTVSGACRYEVVEFA